MDQKYKDEKAARDEFIKKHREDLERAERVLADGDERLKQIKANSAREKASFEYLNSVIREGIRRKKEAENSGKKEAEKSESEAKG